MSDDNSTDPGSNGMRASASGARLQSLLERVCDQLVSAVELEELGELLAADKEVREYYLEYLSLHSSLQNYAWPAPQSSLNDGSERDEDHVPRRRPSLRRMTAILAAAATIAAAAVGLYLRGNQVDAPIVASDLEDRRSERESSPVARVSQLSDDILGQSPNDSVALHSHVSVGHILKLARGEMRLTYPTGVELRLLGPAEFVVGSSGGRLQRGGVRAVVPEKGRGFTIETPNGKVIDLGTEFGVAVDDFGVSEVNVFQGMVDMVPEIRGGEARSMRLTKGEAAQWNSDTVIRLDANTSVFGGSSQAQSGKKLEDSRPIIDERFKDQVLSATKWSTFGNVTLKSGSSLLQDAGDSIEFPYLITTEEFAPSNGPLTVVADIRFIDIGPNSAPTFAVLTRSANERDIGVNVGRRTMRTGVRCSFTSEPASSSAMIEVATKLDPLCALTNNQWRGFDQLQENVPYRLVMRDDGINVTFTVALRDDPSVSKTVTCRSLFRGKQNYVVLEGANGAVAVDRIQLFQDSVAKVIARNASKTVGAADGDPKRMRLVTEELASMAPKDGRLVVSDNFDGPTINESVWTTLDDVSLINGRIRIGKPNSREHINTYTGRPYLLTRGRFAPAEGPLTVIGTVEFDTNFLNEYGGSFAVMTRADNSRGKGPGWEYSILQRGIRQNFWPAAWGQQHSLEIHEKPSPTSLSLLVSEGLEINPEAREYFFKVVDDGDRATLTIQDTHDATIRKTVSVHTSSALKEGCIGFESCWGCPVWLDNVRIYKSAAAGSGDK
jgi:hypothetical protein